MDLFPGPVLTKLEGCSCSFCDDEKDECPDGCDPGDCGCGRGNA